MVKSISFIGSFRKEKHYRKVVECVKLFKEKGFIVNSPRGSAIIDSIEDFVIFETDEKGLSPAEIQMITLDKIIHSDVIYVCNVDGYVGKTTCYEIGFCMSRKKPLYFLNPPIDLPIPIMDNQVVSPEELLNIAFKGKEINVEYSFNDSKANNAIKSLWSSDKSTLSNNGKRLVICGSMAFYNQMKICKILLEKDGINAIIPKEENEIISSMNGEEFRNFKRKVSNTYLKKIREKETEAILVFNEAKKGIDNYIGANTFVELAMAFMWNRKIYLLNDIYKPYEDELMAWNVKCLRGNLNLLIDEWNRESKEEKIEPFHQMTLEELGVKGYERN